LAGSLARGKGNDSVQEEQRNWPQINTDHYDRAFITIPTEQGNEDIFRLPLCQGYGVQSAEMKKLRRGEFDEWENGKMV
jgi:hypothetical protein